MVIICSFNKIVNNALVLDILKFICSAISVDVAPLWLDRYCVILLLFKRVLGLLVTELFLLPLLFVCFFVKYKVKEVLSG